MQLFLFHRISLWVQRFYHIEQTSSNLSQFYHGNLSFFILFYFKNYLSNREITFEPAKTSVQLCSLKAARCLWIVFWLSSLNWNLATGESDTALKSTNLQIIKIRAWKIMKDKIYHNLLSYFCFLRICLEWVIPIENMTLLAIYCFMLIYVDLR